MKETAQKSGKTVIYVSHNMSNIRQLCNRCIVLDCGKIIFEGDTEEPINIYTGQYCLAPELYSISEYGTRHSHHKSGTVVTFEILSDKSTTDDLELDRSKAGFIKLTDLITIS